ncbi:regulator of protease activity HflC (stomatin/prohibitin superfamily) [Halarchaeum solikamskense]|uniref:LWR-salt protein n=1 Tax=Halarchaeum nitratireducens TaxID=489913 RepID=UPI001B3AF6D5|nr:LWR-salt protein [Halarchaeum solikamskense]MBP2251309.1 regulator of protease activity HflC (stomatin/prohibitin superfamily) [Halarchaeum solikamskense]
MEGRYVFGVRFRVDPTRDVTVDPDEFETRLSRPAETPSEGGWLFFRDNLWRGDLADESHFRKLTAAALGGVTVLDVNYRAFEVDAAYREAFRAAIAADLDAFRADTVDEVVRKYLGSSLEVDSE